MKSESGFSLAIASQPFFCEFWNFFGSAWAKFQIPPLRSVMFALKYIHPSPDPDKDNKKRVDWIILCVEQLPLQQGSNHPSEFCIIYFV